MEFEILTQTYVNVSATSSPARTKQTQPGSRNVPGPQEEKESEE